MDGKQHPSLTWAIIVAGMIWMGASSPCAAQPDVADSPQHNGAAVGENPTTGGNARERDGEASRSPQQAASDALEALKSAIETTIAEATQKLRGLSAQLKELDDQLGKLRAQVPEIGKTEEELAQLRAEKEQLKRTLDRTISEAASDSQRKDERARFLKMWAIAAALLACGAVAVAGLMVSRRRGRQPRNDLTPSPVCTRPFTGSPRPDMFRNLGLAMQDMLVLAKESTQWSDAWSRFVADSLRLVANEAKAGTSTEIGLFLADFWVPILARFDPDDVGWKWTQDMAAAACPSGWRIEVRPGPDKGALLAVESDRIDRVIAPGGTQVRAVLCPNRVVHSPDGRQTERKATVSA